MSGWVDNIFLDSKTLESANSNHYHIASNRVSKVILARWVVFNTFIKVANELELEVDTIKHDWLMFQILPSVCIDLMDPFQALLDVPLSNVNSEVLTIFACPAQAAGRVGLFLRRSLLLCDR